MTVVGRLVWCGALLAFCLGCSGDTGEDPLLAADKGGIAGKGVSGAGRAGASGSSGSTSGSGGSQAGGAAGSSSCKSGGCGSGNGGASGSAGVGGAVPVDGPTLGGCPLFPIDDVWNRDVSAAPTDPVWTRRLANLVGDVNIHPDFGGGYGIPINVVPESQPKVGVNFYWYDDESDPGPYPFPEPGIVSIEGNDPLECDGDCHLLVVQQGVCQLFEGYACYHAGGWLCGGGARWDLRRASYGQREKGWTSADAAGLAITPGVLRYAEVRAGEVRHALRFTVPCTGPHFVAPATHYAVPGSCDEDDPNAPPMGLRVRLRADYDMSGASPSARVVLRAMQRYGMILADNGSSFYFQGEANAGWTEDDIEPLKDVPASAFEVIELPPLEN